MYTTPCRTCVKFFSDKCDGMLDDKGRCAQQQFTGLIDAIEMETTGKPHDGKADNGKPDLNLVDRYFPNALEGVAKVAEFGAKKYGADTWRDVPDGLRRYNSALRRHQIAIEKGEVHDDESGLPHIDHVCFNAMAVRELSKLNHEKG